MVRTARAGNLSEAATHPDGDGLCALKDASGNNCGRNPQFRRARVAALHLLVMQGSGNYAAENRGARP